MRELWRAWRLLRAVRKYRRETRRLVERVIDEANRAAGDAR